MKQLIASVSLIMGAALLTEACSKDADNANVTTNEMVVTEESDGFNDGAPDLNAAADLPTANEPLANIGVGNAAATPN